MEKPKILILVANGNEDIELIATIDILRRAGLFVTTLSVENKEVTTAHGISIITDAIWNEVDFTSYQMLILPGGMQGVSIFKKLPQVKKLIQQFYAENKYIAAICAAPLVLHQAGILAGKKVTIYPTFADDLQGAIYQNMSVVIDGNIITGKSVAYTFDFALTLVEILCGSEKKIQVAQKMYYQI